MSMEIRALKERLAPHAESLCTELFPEGRIEGGSFKLGNIKGDRGRSLSVILHGEMAGRWTDFEADETGDLIDLVCHRHQKSVPEAMTWVQERFGITDNSAAKIRSPAPTKYSKPVPPPQTTTPALHEFLESRGFRDVGELVYRHKIYATDALRTAGTDLVFQFFDAAGEIAFLKNKPLDYDGNPGQCNQKNLKSILYGWHTIPAHAKSVWIAEGELDAIALRELGFAALSVPSGASNLKWIDVEYGNLDRFEELVIATDQDDPGEKCAAKILERFAGRSFRVRFPAKDANDLLKAQGYDKARETLKAAYEEGKWQAPSQLRSVNEFEGEVDAFFDAKANDSAGFGSGWEKFDENDVRFREHDLAIVTGFNGSGKSMWLNHLMLNAIRQDRKVLIASMEMTPRYTLGRMLMQVTADGNPEKDWRRKALDWLAPNLWMYVDDLTPNPNDLIRAFEYSYRRYGINVFVVDSLTNMIGHEDFAGQQKFVERLVQFKLNFPVTIFLVAHVRKQDDESRAPGKFDIKGSSAISDLADVAIGVWKNKPKIEHLELCELLDQEPDEKITSQWDMYLEVLKNRHGLWEGKVGFEFDAKSCQYLERRNGSARPYVSKPRPQSAPI